MRSKTAGSAALKSALRKLAKTTSTLPALNSAVDLLSSCVDVLSISGQSGEEYEELADSIATSVQTLEGHLAQRGPVALKESVLSVITYGVIARKKGIIEQICRELKKQAEYITAKQGHARLSRYMDAEEEIEDILRCYRRIGALLQQLNSDATLSVWKITHETHGVASESLHVASQGLNINKRTLKEHLAVRYF
ncbi:hypothetical protein FRC07_002861 [Ceratobasidium sp. 392]|nr:hypothetical protein FRC07_002861 [Ceratobasidium sp. 392]